MRFGYADPPYVGQSRKHYGGAEVNHRLLIAHLRDEFPDGWALSCSSPSLEELLHLCRLELGPNKVRIGAWAKPFHILKRGVRPSYGWEPLIYRGGRNKNPEIPPKGGRRVTPQDYVIANITLRRGTVGAKPRTFSYWVFDMLNVKLGDELVDLFPGSGAVAEAWERYHERFIFDGEGELTDVPGFARCRECGNLAMNPLSSCRTCGEPETINAVDPIEGIVAE